MGAGVGQVKVDGAGGAGAGSYYSVAQLSAADPVYVFESNVYLGISNPKLPLLGKFGSVALAVAAADYFSRTFM